MKLMKKNDGKEFDRVCALIRQALHMEHWRCEYEQECENPEHGDDANATCFAPPLGNRRVWIHIKKPFYEDSSAEQQRRTLIHEHVHALLSPYDQASVEVRDLLHRSDRDSASFLFKAASEGVTDHLEAVLWDLLRERF